jgi:hypothetical protein
VRICQLSGTQPVDEQTLTIYAYELAGLMEQDEERPGFLVELAKELVTDPELPVAVHILPSALLMKCSLIQAVGIAAIGKRDEFSAIVRQDLNA